MDHEVAKLALASLVVSVKRTNRAGERCKKRMQRAVARLSAISDMRGAKETAEACEALRRTCRLCGRCVGI